MSDQAIYVVIRRDLKMRRGKEIAQGIHAMGGLGYVPGLPVVVTHVPGPAEIGYLLTRLIAEGIPYYATKDAGLTEVPAGTTTALAFGPVEKGSITMVSSLSLY